MDFCGSETQVGLAGFSAESLTRLKSKCPSSGLLLGGSGGKSASTLVQAVGRAAGGSSLWL